MVGFPISHLPSKVKSHLRILLLETSVSLKENLTRKSYSPTLSQYNNNIKMHSPTSSLSLIMPCVGYSNSNPGSIMANSFELLVTTFPLAGREKHLSWPSPAISTSASHFRGVTAQIRAHMCQDPAIMYRSHCTLYISIRQKQTNKNLYQVDQDLPVTPKADIKLCALSNHIGLLSQQHTFRITSIFLQ